MPSSPRAPSRVGSRLSWRNSGRTDDGVVGIDDGERQGYGMSYELSGFDGKVAVVTGAGRMRAIGRTGAMRLAAAGCDVVITGTGRPVGSYPEDEKAAGWRDIESVAEEIRQLGRR